MTETELGERKCVPCEGGVAPLTLAESRRYLGKLAPAWTLADDVLRTVDEHLETPLTVEEREWFLGRIGVVVGGAGPALFYPLLDGWFSTHGAAA